MKRFLILLSLIALTYSISNAQLRVDSVGKVHAVGELLAEGGFTFQNLSGLTNLRLCKYSNGISTRSYNLIAESHTQTLNNYNVYSAITDSLPEDSSNKYYGVYSLVSGTRSPYSYAVLGKVGWKGIGVYGTTSSTLPPITHSYAGYFSGPTHVQGNLTVSGNISGIFLNNAANPSSSISTSNEMADEEQTSLPNRLQTISAHTYYINVPQQYNRVGSSRATYDSYTSSLQEDDGGPIDEMVVGMPQPTPMEKQIYSKQHYGLDANQLEDVFPDLVYENEDGTKSINYVEMVPILVQAINELNAKIEVLEGGSAKKAATRATDIEDTGDDVTMLSLGQNKPNPFGTSTDIEVSVPNGVKKAFIYVYDLQGKKIDQVDIIARGKQAIQLNAASLGNGMYLYSLIADGKVVETRRMIVEK